MTQPVLPEDSTTLQEHDLEHGPFSSGDQSQIPDTFPLQLLLAPSPGGPTTIKPR